MIKKLFTNPKVNWVTQEQHDFVISQGFLVIEYLGVRYYRLLVEGQNCTVRVIWLADTVEIYVETVDGHSELEKYLNDYKCFEDAFNELVDIVKPYLTDYPNESKTEITQEEKEEIQAIEGAE